MKESIHIKYLISNEQDLQWGITVDSVGFQAIKPYEPYPPQNHPMRYLFSTEQGRVLNEYQLIYLTQGAGTFISANSKQIDLKPGNMYLLFPGEWHNYKPLKKTGWNEYWIGFNGINIDRRVENGFFNKEKPVFNVGVREEVVQLYKQAIEIAKEQRTGFQQMLAGFVNLLLGYAYSFDKLSSFDDLDIVLNINKAKTIMMENYHTDITPETISQQLNMSYSWFRRIFKQYTGLSPHQYIQKLKIEKGKELLTNTNLSRIEIAFRIGYENADYFCTAFKKHVGVSPVKYRSMTAKSYNI